MKQIYSTSCVVVDLPDDTHSTHWPGSSGDSVNTHSTLKFVIAIRHCHSSLPFVIAIINFIVVVVGLQTRLLIIRFCIFGVDIWHVIQYAASKGFAYYHMKTERQSVPLRTYVLHGMLADRSVDWISVLTTAHIRRNYGTVSMSWQKVSLLWPFVLIYSCCSKTPYFVTYNVKYMRLSGKFHETVGTAYSCDARK